MCLMHPIGKHKCAYNHDYINYGRCFSEITLPSVKSIGEEYQLLANAGWIVVPTTGTYIFCSEKCAGSWANSVHRIKPNK